MLFSRDQAVNLSLGLPVIPTTIISIPLIRSATEIMTPSKGRPILTGCTITISEIARLATPTPTCSALDRPWLSPRIPWTILEIPLKKSAIAPRSISIADVKIGNCIKTIEKATISNPIPILTRRDLLALELAIPVATRSMPITSNITESIIIIEKIAGPMYSIMIRESVMQIAPRTICNIRSQGGISSNLCNILLT